MKVVIIGGGNLGLAILNGLLKGTLLKPESLTVTKRNLDPIRYLEAEGVTVTSDNVSAAKQADFIILAVKPYNIQKILAEIATVLTLSKQVLISVATGVRLEEMQNWSGLNLPCFRAMPNTAADVMESVTAICSKDATASEEQFVHQLFNEIGITLSIEEHLMEAATIMGSCGIAYVFRFIRAMIQGGIQVGFDAQTANTIVTQTIKGAATLLMERNSHPEEEIDKVTTPKGCTIVGLNEMEHSGFSSALIKGIVSSYDKIERK